ncbi:OmpA family protein, partial [Fulvivirga sp.]|uniref:OmpA family protein n=1 Tax=Fulvivirga sp. TaxID=1931237 RepID=UPI0032F02893
GIRAGADGSIGEHIKVDLRNYTADGDHTLDHKDLKLVPIEEKAVVTLNNVFFDFDKAVLKPESFAELNRVVELMKKETKLKIEVAGHTDNIGTKEYNQQLSLRRANAVKNYLVEKDIDSSRVPTVGYGEERPISSNDDEEEGRALNRRVEFKIIKND